MLYYADREREVSPGAILLAIRETVAAATREWPDAESGRREWTLAHHAGLVGAAIALGEIHQGVADLLCTDADDAFPETDELTKAGILIGRCVYRSWLLFLQDADSWNRGFSRSRRHGTRLSPAEAPIPGAESPLTLLSEAGEAIGRVATLDLPSTLRVRVPEGYAYYSLYPEMYFTSLERLLESEPNGDRYVVIGIRSIGTSLATLVAGALQERGLRACAETVRPRGHPFDRYINLAPLLQRRLRDALAGTTFLVVDEGPGLTCSSFLSVCSTLEALGVPEGKVAVLAAWRGKPSVFASDDMRARWERTRVFHTHAADALGDWREVVPFVRRSLERGGSVAGAATDGREVRIDDLSYGQWRERCYPSTDQWPVIHRANERTKLLFRFERPIIGKFAGLGKYGKEKLERARILAEAGFAPPVAGMAYGFLLQPRLDGRPLAPSDLSEPLMARMAGYYAFVARHFAVPPGPRFAQISEMVALNSKEAIGADATAFLDRWRLHQEGIDSLPLAKLDGRPFPHEWLEVVGASGPAYLKTDAADHFEDHALVGEQSILWDLAGACEEWEMDAACRRSLLAMWERETGDGTAGRYLDFFRAAYLAFRTAELHYAIHSTNEEDIRLSLQHRQWQINRRLAELVCP